VKQAIRAFLRPDHTTLDVRAAGSRRLEGFIDWVRPFGPEVSEVVREHLRDESTTIVAPHPSLARFKLAPDGAIDLVSRTADELAARLPASAAVLWAFDALETHGLDANETEALLGPWFAVDAVHAVGDGRQSRVLAVLRVRDERLALACTIDDVVGLSRGAIDMLDAHTLPFWCPVAVAFVSATVAARLAARHMDPRTRSLRQLFASEAIAPGVFVPAGAVTMELEAAARAVRAFAAGAPVRHVRFENPDEAPQSAALAAAGLTIDSSYVFGASPRAPYVRIGAYWPQPFDRRTPAGSRNPDGVLQIVCCAGRADRDLWRRRTGFDRARLTPLLTFSQIEAYHRDEEPLVRGAQTYDRHRVYAWPPPEPATRVTWLDAGPLNSAPRLAAAMAGTRRLAAAIGPRASICNEPRFAAGAYAEATQRLPTTVAAALDDQATAHEYLTVVPAAGPLRADYELFVRALPDRLGDTLEIGSGRGQLASCLSRRASLYACLEIGVDLLVDLRSRLSLPSVSADLHALPFVDAAFDSVIANNVLEHAYDVIAGLAEIRRVLKDGGRLHALIPLDARNPAHQLRAHWWKADEANIASALCMVGLEGERIDPVDMYDLGIRGSFPAANGLTCIVRAVRH